ncbi:MAG: trehalose-6-phosphate synthase [Deltaproteobacteria bacterium]|nr:trehalose-6-phosphate synthase [Deltaproteobacteria bacterium]
MIKRIPIERLIVVSNREPYSIKRGRSEKTVGGLVSALDGVMRSVGGVWIASATERKDLKITSYKVPFDDPAYTARLVVLNSFDMENYYNGYSNRLLWPLCHMALDRVYLRKRYWQSYVKVNRLFAEAVVDEIKKREWRTAFVWLQDYHLALCAKFIKKLMPRVTVAMFWHIPWPPYDVFRVCPQRKEILEGVLANDLIGFQIDSFKTNFLRCVGKELGRGSGQNVDEVSHLGHVSRVKSFPISIDYDWFDSAASEERSIGFMRRFRKYKRLEGIKLGLAVDRLDYTKGLIKSLDAVDMFFSKYHKYQGKFTYVQVAVPTRKVEPFLSYTESVRKRVTEINRKYSRGAWRPIEYIDRKIAHRDLAALYRGADFAKIGSIYDGMNLVAKEYAASQVDLNGVLLISEFAGAAEDLPGATVINPYDIEGCADAMKEALERPIADKRTEMQRARWYIKEMDINRWVYDILKEMKTIK